MPRIKNDPADRKSPDLMIVVTATGPAYRRNDGIYVVPLNCLKV